MKDAKGWVSGSSGLFTKMTCERTLKSLDDERGCGGDDVDLGLTVLDGKLDGYPETLPGTGGLRDIFTDLLR